MPYDIALSAVAMENMDNVCYSYYIYRLRFFDDIDLLFKAYMFKSAAFYEQANLTYEGSGKRYVISLTKFKKLKVYYPSDIEEQRAIGEVLSNMDSEIQALQDERKKYALIKQGMMQELLTGKTRI
jgi:type I restriction enzyme S subunit